MHDSNWAFGARGAAHTSATTARVPHTATRHTANCLATGAVGHSLFCPLRCSLTDSPRFGADFRQTTGWSGRANAADPHAGGDIEPSRVFLRDFTRFVKRSRPRAAQAQGQFFIGTGTTWEKPKKRCSSGLQESPPPPGCLPPNSPFDTAILRIVLRCG